MTAPPMKKIGILFGQEHSFPPAFVERVNQKTGGKDIAAEFVKIDKVIQGEPCGYDVVIDRISQDVPFYRAWLKNAALTGTAVVNNPFWWSADEKFFNNALATKIGVAVPRTVLLPSNQPPPDTNDKSFRNLGYPLDWEGIFNYVGWPAFFKPFAGGGWKNVYRLHNREEFFRAYNDTGQLVMMLQEEIKFDMWRFCNTVNNLRMDKKCVQLWQRLAAALKPEISDDSFKRWFSTVELVEAKEKSITLTVPNNIYQLWIESNYMRTTTE